MELAIKNTGGLRRTAELHHTPGVVMPQIKISKRTRALVETNKKHGVSKVFEINHKSLERNKYAPWSRGSNSGLAS